MIDEKQLVGAGYPPPRGIQRAEDVPGVRGTEETSLSEPRRQLNKQSDMKMGASHLKSGEISGD